MPHLVINGFKNVLAIALGTEYSFPQADKVGRHAASRMWGPGTTLQVVAVLRGVQTPQHTCHDMPSTDTPTPSAVFESQIKEILENPELLAAATAASAAPAGGDGGSKEEAKEEAKEEVRIWKLNCHASVNLQCRACCGSRRSRGVTPLCDHSGCGFCCLCTCLCLTRFACWRHDGCG